MGGTDLEVVNSTHGSSFPEKPRFADDLVGEGHPAPDRCGSTPETTQRHIIKQRNVTS